MDYPTRHVHLDFHTSEHIPGVGARFDRRQWQQALKAGRVNSINIFAKCHHGWSYYPTKVGNPHPNLTCNLLGEQIEACHQIGVRAPIYYTVGWSANDARQHPDWVARRKDGTVLSVNYDEKAKPADPRPHCSWIMLCPSGDYLELIKEQTDEICRTFDVDGLWYDICFSPCWCERCRAEMKARGLDPDNSADAARHNFLLWDRMTSECNAIVHARFPKANCFYNGGADIYQPAWRGRVTQYELEDLPTTWGGYDKFPLRSRCFAELGKPIVAMSGKFHTSWGEFGGFKHPEAMRYEAAAMIAYGANCCFGDQLHPSGLMDAATYGGIGHAYRYVEKIEAYGLGGAPASNLGLWLSGPGAHAHNQGVVNMLLEGQRDFRVVGPDSDLSPFDAVVLTGDVRLNEASAGMLAAFIARGGGVLALATSGMDEQGSRFLLDIGADYVGPPRFVNDYILTGKATALAKGLVTTPFLCYSAAQRVRPTDGQPLAAIREPYFDRTYEHYCSHMNTPFQLDDAPHPAAVRKGKVVYLAHGLGKMYHDFGARLHRDYFLNALRLVHRRPNFTAALPSAGRATFIHQPQQRRYVAHLLYGPPLQRGTPLVIEDLVALRDVTVDIRVTEKVRRAYLVPGKKPLRMLKRAGGTLRVTVPEFACHAAVVFEY